MDKEPEEMHSTDKAWWPWDGVARGSLRWVIMAEVTSFSYLPQSNPYGGGYILDDL